MAKVVYVNGGTGSDANSGLTPALAKATIVGARAATATGDRVSIAAGVYLEIDASFTSANDINVVYMHDGSGPVIVDFANRATAGQHWFLDKAVRFIGIQFRNPGTSTYCISSFSVAANVVAVNCVFYQKAGAANTGRGVERLFVYNCSFHNLSIGVGVSSTTFSSYMLLCTTPFSGSQSEREYNALPSNTETYGINITTGANPGFRDPASDDFRLDPSDIADFQTFMAGGRYRGRIGATGTYGPYYNSLYAQTRMITPDPTPGAFASWEDDPSYVSAGTLGAVVQDATTGELQFNLSATPTATDGRLRSDVYAAPSGKVFRFTGSSFDRFEDRPGGAVLDTNVALPAHWEYRSSNDAFLKSDVFPVWVAVAQTSVLNILRRYVQFRVTLRSDHPNT